MAQKAKSAPKKKAPKAAAKASPIINIDKLMADGLTDKQIRAKLSHLDRSADFIEGMLRQYRARAARVKK
jgi:hypothetical protein